jgi:lipoyl-dependent peroxiredoxin
MDAGCADVRLGHTYVGVSERAATTPRPAGFDRDRDAARRLSRPSAPTRRSLQEKGREVKILYTAEAVVEGGREGHGRTSDGRLDVDLSVPEDMGGGGGPGTNPEQLFAVGYAACFQSALLNVANGRKLDASSSRITSRVGLGPTGHGGLGLAVSLDLHAPQLSPSESADLMARAHELCPYSNATRGNIDVTLTVDGASIDEIRAA